MIHAVEYMKPMDSGYSNPQLFLCEDGNKYVIKFKSNPQGLRVLANEMISYRLARLLDLPVPKGEVIFISQTLILQNPMLQHLQVQEGLHYGSRFIENAQNIFSGDLSNVVNVSKGADMILFDHWLNNNDRHLLRSTNNNILISNSPIRQFWMIDQANIMNGPNWSISSLSSQQASTITYWGEIYQKFVPYIDSPHPFKESLTNLMAIEKWKISEAISALPSEWGVTEYEQLSLIEFLAVRQKYVASSILNLKPYFPVWQNSNY